MLILTCVLLSVAVELVLAWSPTNGYSPGFVSCPKDRINFLRAADELCEQETSWLQKRNAVTVDKMKDFLKYTAKLDESEYRQLLSSSPIKVALSYSGGGLRSMLTSGGQLASLDNRTAGSFEKGLGGLLQASTYLSGLSGGNWMVGTFAMNNWTSIEDILRDEDVWDLTTTMYAPENTFLKNYQLWVKWIDSVKTKKSLGFPVSFVDFWALAILDKVLNSSNPNTLGSTWSSLQDEKVFQNGQMPFPLVVSQVLYPGKDVTLSESTQIEINPFEFGSWDPHANQFTDVKYIGTNFTNGVPDKNDKCVEGFDNTGFVLASSSDIFNLLTEGVRDKLDNLVSLYNLVKGIFTSIEDTNFDHAVYINPFYQSTLGGTTNLTSQRVLSLVDGSEDGINIPISQLAIPNRGVDIIFTFDNSADVNRYPDGTSLVNAYQRQFTAVGTSSSFPYVPPQSTFFAKNFTHRPVFFGCDAKNLTKLKYIPPLVAYIPNTGISLETNISTFQMVYPNDLKRKMIQNGFEVTTRNNLTDDSDWQKCVGCAVVRRSQERAGILQSDDCKKCFEQYCWDGTV